MRTYKPLGANARPNFRVKTAQEQGESVLTDLTTAVFVFWTYGLVAVYCLGGL